MLAICPTSEMHFTCDTSPYQVTIMIILQMRKLRLEKINNLPSLTTRKWQNQVHRMGLPWPVSIHLPVCHTLWSLEWLSRTTESQRYCACGTEKSQMVNNVSWAHRGNRALIQVVGALAAKTRYGRGARMIATKLQSKDLRNRQRVKCRVRCNKDTCGQCADPKWLGREDQPDSRQKKNFNW